MMNESSMVALENGEVALYLRPLSNDKALIRYIGCVEGFSYPLNQLRHLGVPYKPILPSKSIEDLIKDRNEKAFLFFLEKAQSKIPKAKVSKKKKTIQEVLLSAKVEDIPRIMKEFGFDYNKLIEKGGESNGEGNSDC